MNLMWHILTYTYNGWTIYRNGDYIRVTTIFFIWFGSIRLISLLYHSSPQPHIIIMYYSFWEGKIIYASRSIFSNKLQSLFIFRCLSHFLDHRLVGSYFQFLFSIFCVSPFRSLIKNVETNLSSVSAFFSPDSLAPPLGILKYSLSRNLSAWANAAFKSSQQPASSICGFSSSAGSGLFFGWTLLLWKNKSHTCPWHRRFPAEDSGYLLVRTAIFDGFGPKTKEITVNRAKMMVIRIMTSPFPCLKSCEHCKAKM